MERRSDNRTLRRTLAAVGVATAALLAGPMERSSAQVLPICFPVLDPVNYSNNFGAPRGGGRTHEGVDIMGAKMHRLVSAVDGVIVDVRGPGGSSSDHGIRIRGDDGYYYAYLHMNNDTPGTDDGQATWDQVFAPGVANGARVRGGQLLGFMGDSGNAEGAGAHLHFEIRTPAPRVWDSVAVNPYESLLAARRCAPLSSPTHPYTAFHGYTESAPDAASPRWGILDSFVRGGDDQLWHRAWVGDFTPWTPLGGIVRGGPAAVSPSPDRVDVFVRGQDDQLWHRWRTLAGWSGWEPLGGLLTSDPDAASSGNGDITVAARGIDGALWYRTYDGAAWGNWTTLGGALTSGPAVASPAPGQLSFFVRSTDDALWWSSGDGAGWTGWIRVESVVTSDPDAAVMGGAVHLVVRGGDHRLYYLNHTAGGGWGLISLEASATGPSIVSWGPGRLDVYAVGADFALYQTWWNGSGW